MFDRFPSFWRTTASLSLLFVASLHANYCIQIVSLPENQIEQAKETATKISKRISWNSDLRIEKIGRYLTLRIGDYIHFKDAKKTLEAIKRFDKDAYVRKCDIVPSRIVARFGKKATEYEKNRKTGIEKSFVSHHEAQALRDFTNPVSDPQLWEKCRQCLLQKSIKIPSHAPTKRSSTPNPRKNVEEISLPLEDLLDFAPPKKVHQSASSKEHIMPETLFWKEQMGKKSRAAKLPAPEKHVEYDDIPPKAVP